MEIRVTDIRIFRVSTRPALWEEASKLPRFFFRNALDVFARRLSLLADIRGLAEKKEKNRNFHAFYVRKEATPQGMNNYGLRVDCREMVMEITHGFGRAVRRGSRAFRVRSWCCGRNRWGRPHRGRWRRAAACRRP